MRAAPAAAQAVELLSPASDLGRWTLAWGDQLDIRPILLDARADRVSERAVAGQHSTAEADRKIADATDDKIN
ncbi:hypothetical protein GCM10010412_033120 [Nonomuraea recticatena]|uniref:Uncharacterized protein n=1 Tax=Nonomuraea recticatena TaxID=46178 RepID=A0ABN3RTS2_9ACTN